MANTYIQIKRSSSTATPSSLRPGELGYSYQSNNAFIGTADGTGALPIGGYSTYTSVNNATSANTADTLVKRDSNGAFAGLLYGVANAAVQLQNSRNFSVSGGDITASAVGFNGTGNVVLNASLNSVPSLGAGTYGSQTEIPVIQVAANGRVMNVTTSTISTTLSTSADSGTGSVNLLNQTLSITGGDGITSNVAGQNITVSVDNTVIRTSGAQQIITGDLEISGNLIVTGNTTSIQVDSLNVVDPIIYMAANNYVSDLVDIGWAGNYYDGSSQRHTGVIRKATTNDIYMFTGYNEEFDNNTLNIANPSLVYANVHANLISKYVQSPFGRIDNIYSSTGTVTIDDDLTITGATNFSGGIVLDNGNISANTVTANNLTLANALTVPNGGTGRTSFTSGQIIIGAGTNGLGQIANSSVAAGQTFGSASVVPAFETDVYGRVVSVSNTSIAIDTSAITSGTLGYNRGGTGSTTYSTGALLIAGASGFQSLANTTYSLTGALASNNTITSLTVDAYGRLTAATGGAISGLTVGQGGTGVSTFTSGGMLYGNGSGAIQATAAAGVSDQTWSNQILTTTNAGVPVWSTALDGGSF